MKDRLFDTLNMILSLYAFYELFGKVSAFPNGRIYAAIVILIIAIYYIYLFIKRPYNVRQFDVNSKYCKRICISNQKQIKVKTDKSSHVTVKRRLLFFSEPADDDLFDIYTVHQEDIGNFNYDSPDSVETCRSPMKKDILKVFWKPKKRIEPFQEYMHCDRWSPPVSYDGSLFYSAFHPTERTGKYELTVHTENPLKETYSFLTKGAKRFRDEDDLLKYAQKAKKRLGNPTLENHGFLSKWQIENPNPSYTYWCIFVWKQPEQN